MAKKFDLDESLKAAMQVPKKSPKQFDTIDRSERIKVNFRCSQGLKEEAEEAAKLRGMTFSEYIRVAVQQAADRDLGR